MGAFLLTLGAIIFAGYAGAAFFQRTRVPDAVLLMGIGVLIGPVLGLVDTAVLVRAMPYVGTLALALILFEGGLGLALRQVGRQLGRALLLVGLSFGSTVLVSTWLLEMVAGLDSQVAVLLAVALAATSAPIVVPVVTRIAPGTDIASLLTLESSLADALAVVLATTLLHTGATEGGVLATSLASGIGRATLVGLVAGFAVGMLWLWALATLARGNYPFTLTLGCLLALMGAVELVEGSGAMAILAFGIALANGGPLQRLLPAGVRARLAAVLAETDLALDPRIHHLLGEATLLTRTFFFIYLGAVMRWPGSDAAFWLTLALLVAGLAISRVLSTNLFRIVFPVTVSDRRMILALAPRGLATAVLAALAAQLGEGLAVDPITVGMGVILATNAMMALGVRRLLAAGEAT